MSLKVSTLWHCDTRDCLASATVPDKAPVPPEGWATVAVISRSPARLAPENYDSSKEYFIDEAGNCTVKDEQTKHYCPKCWGNIAPVL